MFDPDECPDERHSHCPICFWPAIGEDEMQQGHRAMEHFKEEHPAMYREIQHAAQQAVAAAVAEQAKNN